jgi:hypothetical protein
LDLLITGGHVVMAPAVRQLDIGVREGQLALKSHAIE